MSTNDYNEESIVIIEDDIEKIKQAPGSIYMPFVS